MKRSIQLMPLVVGLLLVASPVTAREISLIDETVKLTKQLAPDQSKEIEEVAINLKGIDRQLTAVISTVKSFAQLTDQLTDRLESFVPQVAEQLKKVNDSSLSKEQRIQAMVTFINLMQGQIQFMLGFLGNYINAVVDLYPDKATDIKEVITEIQVVLKELQGVITFLKTLEVK